VFVRFSFCDILNLSIQKSIQQTSHYNYTMKINPIYSFKNTLCEQGQIRSLSGLQTSKLKYHPWFSTQLSFTLLLTFWIYIHVRKRNEKWILRLCNFLIKKNVRKISTFLYYRTSETNWRVGFLGGRTWHWALSFCELFFLPNLQLNIGKKYLKTAIIIDESLIHSIVSRNSENQTQNGPYIHEKSKQTKTKIETSDSCFG
jgi:hypothetical protein